MRNNERNFVLTKAGSYDICRHQSMDRRSLYKLGVLICLSSPIVTFAQPTSSAYPPQEPPADTSYIHFRSPPLPRVSDVDMDVVRSINAKYQDVDIFPPLSAVQALSDSDATILKHLVRAARVMDKVYLKQLHPGTDAFVEEALQSRNADLMRFVRHMGSFAESHGQSIIPGLSPSGGQNLYPYDLHNPIEVRRLIEIQGMRERGWVRGLLRRFSSGSNIERLLKDPYTVVRLTPKGVLKAVPYSEAYKTEFQEAAAELDKASSLTWGRWPRFSAYLRERANALRTNKYDESERLWLSIEPDCPFDIVIGPIESYIDEVLGIRAAVESFVMLNDGTARSRYNEFLSQAADFDQRLPVTTLTYDLSQKAYTIPVVMGYEVFRAGEARAGVQAIAFNLPNDPAIRNSHGFKLTLAMNVIGAKAESILRPISTYTLAERHRTFIDREAFTDIVFFHELGHGLGPGEVLVNGKPQKVQQRLGNLYHSLEELKADIVGMWTLLDLIENGKIEKSKLSNYLVTYVTSLFRSIRFGVKEAHGKGSITQLNFFIDKGSLVHLPGKASYEIKEDLIVEHIRELTRVVLDIQAQDDPNESAIRQKADQFLKRYGNVSPEVDEILNKIGTHVPVDLRPHHPLARKLLSPAPPSRLDILDTCTRD